MTALVTTPGRRSFVNAMQINVSMGFVSVATMERVRHLPAGFEHVSARVVITMDADLQDDPSEIVSLVAAVDADRIWSVAGKKFEKILGPKLCRVVSSIWLLGLYRGFHCTILIVD